MVEHLHTAHIDLGLDTRLRNLLEQGDAVGIPHRTAEQVVILLLEIDRAENRHIHAGYLRHAQVHPLHRQQTGVEFAPERRHVFIPAEQRLHALLRTGSRIARLLHLQPQRRLLAFNGRKGTLAHLELLAHLAERRLVILKFNCHSSSLFPIAYGASVPRRPAATYFRPADIPQRHTTSTPKRPKAYHSPL